MKVFVWGDTSYGESGNGLDFERDYYNGLAVVIAETEDEARAELNRARRAGINYAVPENRVIEAKGAAERPVVYELDGPLVFAVHGSS